MSFFVTFSGAVCRFPAPVLALQSVQCLQACIFNTFSYVSLGGLEPMSFLTKMVSATAELTGHKLIK